MRTRFNALGRPTGPDARLRAALEAGDEPGVVAAVAAGARLNGVGADWLCAGIASQMRPDEARPMLAVLKRLGFDVDWQLPGGQCALAAAVQGLRYDWVRALARDHGSRLAATDRRGPEWVRQAILMRSEETLRALIETGAPAGIISADGRSAWHHWAGHGCDIGIFNQLRDARMPLDVPDRDGQTALFVLVTSGMQSYHPFVEKFLDLGPRLDWRDDAGRTALHMLLTKPFPRWDGVLTSWVETLLKRGAPAEPAGAAPSPLCIAIGMVGQDSEAGAVIELLLAHGADPDRQGADGRTAWQLAQARNYDLPAALAKVKAAKAAPPAPSGGPAGPAPAGPGH